MNAQDNPVRERKAAMTEDSTEHLGSSDCSSGNFEHIQVRPPDWVLNAISDCSRGQRQCTTHHLACECRERRLAEEQRFLEAAYQDAVEERYKYKSAVERLRVLLLEVLENDTLSGGLSVLDDEMRQRIRDGLSWKIE
jgi:hypothetical protein